MAGRFDIKTKTFFQIPPSSESDRVVFMDQGFDLNDVHYISECAQVWDLWYQFSIELKAPDKKLDFDFKRKADCLMAQRELSRAWSKTGEFDNAVDAGETP